jgi:hypothetical protein
LTPADVDAAADALARAEGDGARFGEAGGATANALAVEALSGHPGIGALLAMRSELAERYRAAGAPEPVALAAGRVWDEAAERARMEARRVLRERQAAQS